MRALLCVLLAACTHDLAVFDRVEVKPARDLDLLFVFDDSFNRSAYDQMASQLGDLQARLADVDGQLPNLRVGVVTTDLGVRGTMDSIARAPVDNCAGDGNAGKLVTFGSSLPSRGFLEDRRGPSGTRVRNYAGELQLELAALTNPAPGTANTGCDFVQPLEAMRRALDPDVNPGFIRPGAMLSVVFMTNDDDCSLARGALLDAGDGSLGPLSTFRCTEQGVSCDSDELRSPGARANCRPREDSPFLVDVAEYEAFLARYKPDRRDVIVSAVAGARDPFEVRDIGLPILLPSCQGGPGGAAKPAVRLGAIVDRFGGALIDGCAQDGVYQQLTAPILNQQRSCFPDLRDGDGEDCRVVERAAGTEAEPGTETETELVRCDEASSETPCWYTYTDAAACPAGDHRGVGIRRGASTAAPGARVEATCFAR